MTKLRYLAVILFTLAACDRAQTHADSPASDQDAAAVTNVLALDIVGWSFVGADTIKSGWTTIRLNNDSGMAHFGLVYRLPEGVTAEMISDEVVKPFQHSLTASLNGDLDQAAEILSSIPDWVRDLKYMGGPGMISNGVVGEATMYLEPGDYIIECYVKTNGMQHNYNPEPGAHGMVLPFTVEDEAGGMAEPTPTVTLELSNSGYEVTEGVFVVGENIVRASFIEQTLYNGFVGHDAHFFKITPETDVETAAKWVDFFPMDGQQTPAPAKFVGGIHDMPESSVGYFKVNLESSKYGVVAEVPNAQESGFFKIIEPNDR